MVELLWDPWYNWYENIKEEAYADTEDPDLSSIAWPENQKIQNIHDQSLP